MDTSNVTKIKKNRNIKKPNTSPEKNESSLKNPYLLLSINTKQTKDHKSLLTSRINTKLYESLTDKILSDIYPIHCNQCNIICNVRISTRPAVVRCKSCNKQYSRFKNTPLHNLRIPHWMFGFLLHESLLQYPKVLTSTEIQKKLGIAYNSALLLKRRLQLFSIDLMPKIKSLITNLLNQKPIHNLPLMDSNNSKHSILPNDSTPIVNADTLVLYSASQRANKGRMRHRHGGQTASIYLSDAL